MSRKQLKIDAKQAIEVWEARWNEICEWDENEIPQAKQDEFADLALQSAGEIKSALSELIQYMDDIDNLSESNDDDLVELREDLATALKETINYRHSLESYSREALFEELGDLDDMIDVELIFDEDDVVNEDSFNNLPDQEDADSEADSDFDGDSEEY